MANSRKPFPIVGIIAAAIGAVLGSYAVNRGFTNRTANVEKALAQASNELNKTVPLMVDEETRLDGTTAGPGKVLLYRYTLVNVVKDTSLDTKTLENAIRPIIVNQYKTSAGFKTFREAGVSMRYQYSDKNGVFITELVIGPEDLK
jgi:hypothetical protein